MPPYLKVANWQAVKGTLHPIHPVNLSRVQGESIQEVSGKGRRRASETVGHRGIAIDRIFPLRATQRRAPQASHLVASSSVIRASGAAG